MWDRGQLAITHPIENVSDQVTNQRSAENLGGVSAWIDYIDERIRGNQQAEQGCYESGDRGPANPSRQAPAQDSGSGQRNGEHGEVRKSVVGDGGVGEDLEGLLRVHAYVSQQQDEQDQRARAGDGVRWRTEAGMKAAKPAGNELVPTGGGKALTSLAKVKIGQVHLPFGNNVNGQHTLPFKPGIRIIHTKRHRLSCVIYRFTEILPFKLRL